MKNILKLVIVVALTIIMTSTFASSYYKDGKVIMMVSIEVKNYAEWKKAFDAGAPVREKAGIKVLNICRHLENENLVVIFEEAESLQSANDFLSVLKLKQKAGEISNTDIKLYGKAE